MTEGQQWAISQLRYIEAENGAIEIISITPPGTGGVVTVELSVDCRAYKRASGGLPLRAREQFLITVPAEFPLQHPAIDSKHKRFAGFPHVQWGSRLCLYQAPGTEWRPEDGMFGFLERLNTWLRAGALGQLDPIGLPLHPPVVYAKRGQYVVPRVNTPVVKPPWWAGYVEITSETDVAVILGSWHEFGVTVPEVRLAGAILLPEQMPFEYPSTIHELQRILADRNLPAEILKTLLELTALRSAEGKALYIVLGAAMRGVAGTDRRMQHLACWYISPERATDLRTMVLEAEAEEGKTAAEAFNSWANEASVEWCPVREDRPEIVVPRDTGSPMEWWRGKRVVILGCGALGTAVGVMIVRAGVASVKLYDNSRVAPGLLVRQNFDRRQIGYTKASATRVQLLAINPEADITDHHSNIIDALRKDPAHIFDADVVINATASVGVAAVLEKFFLDPATRRPPIISMAIGHRAEYALATFAVSAVPGVTVDPDRRTKVALANASSGAEFLEEFWPISADRTKLFQPEPGCSDPTFVGSAADVLGLSAALLNIASRWLAEGALACARACVLRAPHISRPTHQPGLLEFAWSSDRILVDKRHSFQIRLAPNAERDLIGWIRASERKLGRKVETGGLLFGQIDEFLKVIWITEVSGPPPDSVASKREFVCGIQGTKELNEEKQLRTRGSVHFIGMWHTHPDRVAEPSRTDLDAMEKLREIPKQSLRNFLMLIIGGRVPAHQIEGFLFGRSDLQG